MPGQQDRLGTALTVSRNVDTQVVSVRADRLEVAAASLAVLHAGADRLACSRILVNGIQIFFAYGNVVGMSVHLI